MDEQPSTSEPGEPASLVTQDQDPPLIRPLPSQNARRHGLHTAAIVIPGVESDEEWQHFSAEVLKNLAPYGAVERILAFRVAEITWRLGRVSRAESELIDERQRKEDAEFERLSRLNGQAREEYRRQPPKHYGRYNSLMHEMLNPADPPPVPRRLLPVEAQLNQIIRYEAHLGRQLRDALHELEAMQARRHGRPAPLARLDVQLTRHE